MPSSPPPACAAAESTRIQVSIFYSQREDGAECGHRSEDPSTGRRAPSSHRPPCPQRECVNCPFSPLPPPQPPAAGAASRLTAAAYDLDDDGEDDVVDVGDEDEDDEDDSIMLVSEKPAARPPPGKKASFNRVLGEVLRVMQNRLVSNA